MTILLSLMRIYLIAFVCLSLIWCILSFFNIRGLDGLFHPNGWAVYFFALSILGFILLSAFSQIRAGLSQGKTLKDILSGMNNNGNDGVPHVNHQNLHNGSHHTFGSIHSSGYSNSYQPSSSFSDPSGWTRDPSYSQIPGHSLYRRND